MSCVHLQRTRARVVGRGDCVGIVVIYRCGGTIVLQRVHAARSNCPIVHGLHLRHVCSSRRTLVRPKVVWRSRHARAARRYDIFTNIIADTRIDLRRICSIEKIRCRCGDVWIEFSHVVEWNSPCGLKLAVFGACDVRDNGCHSVGLRFCQTILHFEPCELTLRKSRRRERAARLGEGMPNCRRVLWLQWITVCSLVPIRVYPSVNQLLLEIAIIWRRILGLACGTASSRQ